MKFDITFEDFKKEGYFDSFAGYMPTYITADEEFEERGLICVNIEMIAPFRMADGPSRFFRVMRMEITKDQYEQIKDYMRRAGEAWLKSLTQGAEKVYEYSNKFTANEDV